MICKKCDIEMKHPKHQGDSYYLCDSCGDVQYDYKSGNEVNLGNTFLIDKEYDKEVDRVVDRGRD